jgi:hypothetical protein
VICGVDVLRVCIDVARAGTPARRVPPDVVVKTVVRPAVVNHESRTETARAAVDADQVREGVVVDVVSRAVAEASDAGAVDDVVEDLVVARVVVKLDSPTAALGVVPAALAV